MPNLVVDIGNTRTKVAVFEQNKIVMSFPTNELTVNDITSIKNEYPEIESAIFSTVRSNADVLHPMLKANFKKVVELNQNTQLPIEICYETTSTLGKDRIAAAVGANYFYPNCDLLVIDAGTAITYDFVNYNNQYTGGFITPGLNMRFKALHQFTDKLPLLKASAPQNHQGRNTTESIIGGIQMGLEGEIGRIITHFQSKSDEMLIILTGGDTKYFEKLLKNYNFVSLEIILPGLNTILEFIKTKKVKKTIADNGI
ncbi:MAG: type III pantothenate kinase [Prolixibacteraceae bacterium]|jgi:type III pantothenate kinase|nr:type III pantothenate kinase [Prolixibacteraceae bacterium]